MKIAVSLFDDSVKNDAYLCIILNKVFDTTPCFLSISTTISAYMFENEFDVMSKKDVSDFTEI